MTEHDMRLLLAVVKHHMDMDLRAQLIAQVPQAYNALVGHEVATVTHADGRVARAQRVMA